MKKVSVLSAIILVAVCSLACSSTPKLKVKAKPADGDYEQCPNCHGTGIIIVRDSGRFTNDLYNRDREKDKKAACCLLPAWLIALSADEDKKKNNPVPDVDKTGKPVIKDGSRDGFDYDAKLEKNVPEKSIVEKPVTCPRCKGKGWIPYLPPKSPQEPYNYQNLRELNERLNQKSNP